MRCRNRGLSGKADQAFADIPAPEWNVTLSVVTSLFAKERNPSREKGSGEGRIVLRIHQVGQHARYIMDGKLYFKEALLRKDTFEKFLTDEIAFRKLKL